MKKQLLWYILGLIIVIGGFALWYSRTNSSSAGYDNEVILYYSDTCPHCKNVEAFIEENGVMQKYPILQRKESQINQANLKEMIKKSEVCGIPRNELGFPLLWTGSDCVTGDVGIIDFLRGKI